MYLILLFKLKKVSDLPKTLSVELSIFSTILHISSCAFTSHHWQEESF